MRQNAGASTTTLGANAVSMGLAGAFTGWAAFRVLRRAAVSLPAAAAAAGLLADVATYASAYDDYVQFLADSGFNLDVVFSTTEGRDLAIETSHTLTVPIVEYTTNPGAGSTNSKSPRSTGR